MKKADNKRKDRGDFILGGGLPHIREEREREKTQPKPTDNFFFLGEGGKRRYP